MKQTGSTQSAAKHTGRRFMLFAALILVVSLALSACASQAAVSATEPPIETSAPPAATDTPAAPSGEISDLESLIAALESSGATVERGDVVQDSFFSAGGIFLKVNGQDVQVFEFADAAAQADAAATIQANGYIIGTAAVDWMSQPYFFSARNLIVLYVGTDNATISLLQTTLGDPLTR